jgi:hypothetical protein
MLRRIVLRLQPFLSDSIQVVHFHRRLQVARFPLSGRLWVRLQFHSHLHVVLLFRGPFQGVKPQHSNPGVAKHAFRSLANARY